MDWQKLLYPPNEIEFCGNPWKKPVIFLLVITFMTFIWGLYLLGVSVDEFDLEEYTITSLPIGVQQPHPALQNGTPIFRPIVLSNNEMEILQKHITPAVAHIHGSQLPGKGTLPQVLSSGVIIHPAGYVVTTYHDLVGRQSVYVDVATLNGIKRYQAKLVHFSMNRDLALLKLDTKDRFLYLKLSGSTAPIGTPLYAFGLGMQSQMVAKQGLLNKRGVVTQVGYRNLSRLMSTDAVYSWEQSGGAVMNADIQLEGIGLTTTDSNGRVSGYAIPAHVIINEFKDKVKLTISQPAQIINQKQANGQTVAFAQGPKNSMGMSVATAQTNTATGSSALANKSTPQPSHQANFQIAGFDFVSILGLSILGLVAGVVGGMMTMGGGIIMVTGMFVFFGYGMFLIRPVAFVTNIFTYGAASLRNRSTGLIMWEKVKRLTPWAIAGVVFGYMLGINLDDQLIGYLLGIFAMLMVAKTLHELYHQEEAIPDVYKNVVLADDESQQANLSNGSVDDLIDDLEKNTPVENPKIKINLRDGILGFPMGLVSSLLGISGGVIEVPLQRYIAGISLRNAIANSSVMVFWASLIAAIISLLHGTTIGAFEWKTPLGLALIMIPSSYLGGMLGARLMKHIGLSLLNWIYVVLMFIVGIKMLFGQ